jgi:two-component system, chemotaxis family, sensor kinase CheA
VSLSQYVELFRVESREHIATINHHLLALEADPSATNAIEGLFRAVHTIKGMSATLGFGGVADLAHEMESVLDGIRAQRLTATPELLDVLFSSADALEAGVEDAIEDRPPPTEIDPLVRRLRVFAGAMYPPPADRAAAEPIPSTARSVNGSSTGAAMEDGSADAPAYRVRAMVAANASLPGVRAYLLVQKARQVGVVEDLTPGEADLQSGTHFDGTVSFMLRAEGSVEDLERSLRSVGELAAFQLIPMDAAARHRAAVEAVEAGRLESSTAPGASPLSARGSIDRHVRIDAERLDALMDQVGELVVLRDRLHRVALDRGGDDLMEPVDLAVRLIGELRDEVMRIRMVPVGDIFDRFPRLVRDSARTLGKRVELVVEGSETELDRSLLGRLSDPLVHLLRNALDHGIEAPEERIAAGKPESGRVRLVARRERTRVLIRVQDDGRGVDRERVLGKAISQGILTPAEAAALPDEDVLGMLMRPGFSTAETVTDVSGRGVGLDVVATEVRALGGTLSIESVPGGGSSFSLRLPLTIGIMRAVLVEADEGTYALPVAHVSETVEFSGYDVCSSAGRRVVFFRDEALPLVSLRDLLQLPSAPVERPLLEMVLVEDSDQYIGLEVDRLLGQQEIVIKPFDATRDTLPLFSGATILSDGRPALILDAASVLQLARASGSTLGIQSDSSFSPAEIAS